MTNQFGYGALDAYLECLKDDLTQSTREMILLNGGDINQLDALVQNGVDKACNLITGIDKMRGI